MKDINGVKHDELQRKKGTERCRDEGYEESEGWQREELARFRTRRKRNAR